MGMRYWGGGVISTIALCDLAYWQSFAMPDWCGQPEFGSDRTVELSHTCHVPVELSSEGQLRGSFDKADAFGKLFGAKVEFEGRGTPKLELLVL